ASMMAPHFPAALSPATPRAWGRTRTPAVAQPLGRGLPPSASVAGEPLDMREVVGIQGHEMDVSARFGRLQHHTVARVDADVTDAVAADVAAPAAENQVPRAELAWVGELRAHRCLQISRTGQMYAVLREHVLHQAGTVE